MSLASRKLKFQLVFSTVVVLLALFVTWLVLGQSSRLHDYLIRDSDLPNIWAITTFLPYLFSAVITGNPHSPSMAIFAFALIVQWSLIGFLLSNPLSRLFLRIRPK
jgi:uncharacterized membrane protein YhaH (DUF805 family)